MFDNGRIGASCVPFLTEKGWVEIYHGATKENYYSLGAVLLDREKPWEVLARSVKPLVEPTEEYEIKGFSNSAVFSCGCIVRGENVDIYYGAADKSVGLARLTLKEIYDNMNIK